MFTWLDNLIVKPAILCSAPLYSNTLIGILLIDGMLNLS